MKLKYRFVVKQWVGDDWRWQLVSNSNGMVIAECPFPYTRKADCIKACERLQDWAHSSSIFVNGVELQ